MPQRICWIMVDPVCAGAFQLILSIAAGEQTNAKRSGSLRRE
jgi:hypothetical protein